jgi:hypothetical protein
LASADIAAGIIDGAAAGRLCSSHNRSGRNSSAAPNDVRPRREYLGRRSNQSTLTGTGGREMQNQAQAKTREKISLGSLMLTIIISNIAVLFFIAPYA